MGQTKSLPVRAFTLVAFTLLGAVFGSYFQAFREPSFAKTGSYLSQDYFINTQSFSEVESEKAVIFGLAQQFLLEWRYGRVAELQRARIDPYFVPQIEPGASILRNGIDEFGGTAGELTLTLELLRFLHQQEQHGSFLDEYTRAICKFPTEKMLDELAVKAAESARLLDKSEAHQEVINAVSLVRSRFMANHNLRGLSTHGSTRLHQSDTN